MPVYNYNSLYPNYKENLDNFNIKINSENSNILFDNGKIISKLIFSDNIFNSNSKSNSNYIIDWIISMIINKDIILNKYIFDEIKQINQIEQGDIVKYKYDDHGYYNCTFIEKSNNKYLLNFDKKQILVERNTFKLKNINPNNPIRNKGGIKKVILKSCLLSSMLNRLIFSFHCRLNIHLDFIKLSLHIFVCYIAFFLLITIIVNCINNT